MASSLDPLPSNALLILGPPVVGITLNWFFYGILLMQYLMYLNNSREDKKWLRATVHFIFLLDTVQTIMMMDDVFFWFVYNFGNYSALFKFNLAAIDGPVLDAFVMFVAQIVYCWRLRELGKWTILPVVTAFLALISCVCGIFVGVWIMFLDSTSAHKYSAIEDFWLLSSAVTDIIITSSMTYLLMKYQKEYRFMRRTMMTRLKRMAMLTLETGALTATISIALFLSIITPLAEPHTNITVTIGYVIGKIYSNCFMVLLNQRIYYEKYARENPTTGTFGVLSRTQGDGQNEAAGPMSTLRFNDISTTTTTVMGTDATTTVEHSAEPKNGQGLTNSAPCDAV
ncbi:hypothetical protein D9756_006284 [Leucocoprinus leucothites]|uniref:DUF6534 domain-containing protein n=1 Tax=Leucocoprinus leucothites TaxID=201217 RepID=A0A8H5FXR5_9AGAR|nr:hypothetical protein D9756_006284 [Leucoagaricus leucothites]